MIGEIIETKNRKGELNKLRVIADIGAPEEISIEHIEIVPLPFPKEYSPREYFHCADARDYLDKEDMFFGLHHADAILKTKWKIPEEWKKYRLFFPGTILWGKRIEGPYMPYMYWGHEGWILRFYAFFRKSWSVKEERFVRWRK